MALTETARLCPRSGPHGQVFVRGAEVSILRPGTDPRPFPPREPNSHSFELYSLFPSP
jgi:hypothetical protein